jgi:hypothetical protein
MVKNWENFFSESGGSQENPFQFGMASWLADIGLSVGAVSLANYSISREENAAISSISRRNRRVSNIWNRAANRLPVGDLALHELSHRTGAFGGTSSRRELASIRSKLKLQQPRNRSFLTRLDTSINANKSAISSLKTLKSVAKGIGWGYVVMGGAALAESMFTPSVTRAASQTDMLALQPPILDSQIAYTQRQRALMAIHDSQLGINHVIGAEAQHFHR